jgi:hypothetical protein
MSERQRGEKAEKEEKEEKSWEEKWRRDPLNAAIWAIIFIWAGLVLLAENLGLLLRFRPLEAWPLIFIGAGLIVLLEVLIRLIVPEYRRPVTGSVIFGFILLAIGLQSLVDWGAIWPIALIAIGLAILVSGLVWRH